MEKRKRLGMAMTLIRLTTGIQTKRRVDPQRKIWRRPEITISRSWRRMRKMRRMMTRARKTKVRMQMSPIRLLKKRRKKRKQMMLMVDNKLGKANTKIKKTTNSSSSNPTVTIQTHKMATSRMICLWHKSI